MNIQSSNDGVCCPEGNEVEWWRVFMTGVKKILENLDYIKSYWKKNAFKHLVKS